MKIFKMLFVNISSVIQNIDPFFNLFSKTIYYYRILYTSRFDLFESHVEDTLMSENPITASGAVVPLGCAGCFGERAVSGPNVSAKSSRLAPSNKELHGLTNNSVVQVVLRARGIDPSSPRLKRVSSPVLSTLSVGRINRQRIVRQRNDGIRRNSTSA
jgi:hypothetical protein